MRVCQRSSFLFFLVLFSAACTEKIQFEQFASPQRRGVPARQVHLDDLGNLFIVYESQIGYGNFDEWENYDLRLSDEYFVTTSNKLDFFTDPTGALWVVSQEQGRLGKYHNKTFEVESLPADLEDASTFEVGMNGLGEIIILAAIQTDTEWRLELRKRTGYESYEVSPVTGVDIQFPVDPFFAVAPDNRIFLTYKIIHQLVPINNGYEGAVVAPLWEKQPLVSAFYNPEFIGDTLRITNREGSINTNSQITEMYAFVPNSRYWNTTNLETDCFGGTSSTASARDVLYTPDGAMAVLPYTLGISHPNATITLVTDFGSGCFLYDVFTENLFANHTDIKGLAADGRYVYMATTQGLIAYDIQSQFTAHFYDLFIEKRSEK